MNRRQLAGRVSLQRKWIDDHGGCRAAYIDRYGDPDMSHCYGDGGTAIWTADIETLRNLESTAKKRGLTT